MRGLKVSARNLRELTLSVTKSLSNLGFPSTSYSSPEVEKNMFNDLLSKFQKLSCEDACLVGIPVGGSYIVTPFSPNSLPVCYEFVVIATKNQHILNNHAPEIALVSTEISFYSLLADICLSLPQASTLVRCVCVHEFVSDFSILLFLK